MSVSFFQVIIFLLAGIASIILLTVKFRVHPFFALLIACFVTGLGVKLSFEQIINLIKFGFGDMMSKLCLIIVLGTAIGVLLEKNGSTKVMANFILKLAGKSRSTLAISITGFIVGLPIFCDSGYIVLNGINTSMIRKTGIAIAQMSISLATGLYAVHCLLPPHPGATAVAIQLNVDFGKLIIYGILIAVPAMLVGHWWANKAGKKSSYKILKTDDTESTDNQPVLIAFLPVMVPIVLMAVKSLTKKIGMIGDPPVALAIGVILAIGAGKRKGLSSHLSAAVEKAGTILLIICAGGAFGSVLVGTDIGHHFSESFDLKTMGIWFPFLLTFIIKTAQGSSTVAIITASSIIVSMLGALGLDSDNGRLLTVLAMGAGSMMVSHTNDAYFWVVSKFSDIDIRTMLRVHSIASVFMGLTTMIIIYILSLFIL